MTTGTKLINKQFKTIITSMAHKDLKRLFQFYQKTIGQISHVTTKQMAYKCFECNLIIGDKKSSGYGRSEQEAYINSIKNIIDVLVEEEAVFNILKFCMKKICQPIQQKQNRTQKTSVIKPRLSNVVSFQNNQNKRSKSYLKSVNDSLNISLFKSNSNQNSIQLELEAAKIKINSLELKVKTLQQQNEILKQKHKKIDSYQVPVLLSSITTSVNIPFPTSCTNNSDIDRTRFSLGPKLPQNQYQKLNSSVQQFFTKSELQTKNCQNSKMKVPRLKLQILPSFHGKNNKSINHNFIANQQALGK